ncbi:MAG: hypothetical protein KAY37_00915 [Phycisphaerae bacterium]|nr:hypothetical protein [Phycisphaerae bacterium]
MRESGLIVDFDNQGNGGWKWYWCHGGIWRKASKWFRKREPAQQAGEKYQRRNCEMTKEAP